MKKTLINTASLLLGIVLIYLGYKFILGREQLELLVSKPISFHFYSCLLVLPIYLLGGIEKYVLFRTIYNKRISLYDVITLPFVINLWGYLIPVQGSYLYNTVYFKTKYKIAIENTTSIFLVSLSVSLILAGILGIGYCSFIHFNPYLLLICLVSLLNPLFVFVLKKGLTKLPFSSEGIIGNILNGLERIVSDFFNAIDNKKMMAFLIGMNILLSLFSAMWSVWISVGFNLDLSILQLLLLAFMIKITPLFKLTPGNLGIDQFTTSGIILLVGGSAAAGFTLSLYQAAIYILVAFLVGSVFSVVNMKYFFRRNI
ncbi:MAG: flippase-like domain-containing protein [Flavobacteriales bacterium]|nr:flippase-like domain-containing protein [Flavobacteriales bacterium]